MADNRQAIVAGLRDFIKAGAGQDNRPTAPSATVGGFQTRVLQPASGAASVETMMGNYRQCLERLTNEQRIALDGVVNELLGAL